MKLKIIAAGLIFLFSGLSFVNAQSAKKSKTAKIKMIDLNDAKYSGTTLDGILKKYKGQVIYLDFWASWCGPCKREMPYSQKLKKELAGQDIAFIYMSTDKNPDKWKEMIDQLQITGDHYRLSQSLKQEVYTRFNLQYIPRYILINKDGKVADENAKRPSDPLVTGDIDKLLM